MPMAMPKARLVSAALLLLSVMRAVTATSISDHRELSRFSDAEAARMVEEYEATLQQQRQHHHSKSGPRGRMRTGPARKSLQTRALAIAHAKRAIQQSQAAYAAGEQSYFLAWNDLSDLTDDEYRAFLRSRPDAQAHRGKHRGVHRADPLFGQAKAISVDFANPTIASASAANSSANTSTTPLPKSWSWLDIEGGKYVTPIKNQGTCGSCWAFSALSVIESRFAIEHSVAATPLSVEQVLSCSDPLDHIRSKFLEMVASSQGCEGGMPFLAYEYMSRVSPNGVTCARTYPYVMATTQAATTCQQVPASSISVAWQNGKTDYVAVAQNNEEALMRALLTGPISANMDAEGEGFKQYGGGIYDAKDCSTNGKEVNHAVVLVGYGETEQGEKYWVVRNTWGTMWGENGYMRIARAQTTTQPHGPCNLYLYSTYPVNLVQGAADTATCSDPTPSLLPLQWSSLISFDSMTWLSLAGTSLLCVIAGVVLFVLTERVHQRKEAAGQFTYEQCYDRWVMPTKEQIAVMLARRPAQVGSV